LKISDILDALLVQGATVLSKINFLKTIDIYDVGEDHIQIGRGDNFTLYGVKLESKSNRLVSLRDIKSITNEIRFNIKESQLYIYFIKTENFQAIYVFSFSKSAMKQLAKEFRISLLSGKALVTSLYQLFHIGKHTVSKDNRLVYTEEPTIKGDDFFIPWELSIVSDRFRARMQNNASRLYKNYTAYQAVEFLDRDTLDPVELFREEWEGTISIRLDFGQAAVLSRMRKYEFVANYGDKDFANICKAINNGDNQDSQREILENSCNINITMLLDNKYEGAAENISFYLGCSFDANYLNGDMLFNKTQMLARDVDFDEIVPVRIVTKYFSTSHKKPVDKNKFVYFSGKDISGNFVDFSLQDNTSPHNLFIGRTGSGKSRQAINGLLQILGYDRKTGKALRFNDFKVRYTDVGYTVGESMMSMKRNYGDDVRIFPSRVSTLRFSLFNIDIDEYGNIDEDELEFTINFISFTLEIQSSKTELSALTGGEKYYLDLIIREALKKGKEVCGDLHLSEFETKGTYKELLTELYSQGYDLNTTVFELPEKYNYLKKPILKDILDLVGKWKNKGELSSLEQDVVAGLELKLGGIRGFKFLTFHSNVAETTERMTYIDLDEIKESPTDFNVVYWMMLKNWIRVLKREAKLQFGSGIPNIPTLFYIDESHNFIKYPAFVDLFASAVKELRKVRGYFFFLNQELIEIPESISTQVGSKIFMVSPEEKNKLEETIKTVDKVIKKEDIAIIEHIEDYMMFIMSDIGSVGMKFDYQEGDDALFTPNHPDMLTDLGVPSA